MTALVLCGGGSRRMGVDKTAATLGGTTVLDHLLDALPASWAVVAVGPQRRTRRTVRWAREEPVGGGPVAAVAAALPLVTTELVVVLAGDMPFAAPPALRLAAALRDLPATEAVVASDPGGRANPLLAAYRTSSLRAALPQPLDDAPARSLLALAHTTLPVSAEDSLDVDTPEALETARHRVAT
ncbi:MAG: NTP transferase domain-containing protein [Lapillicoccus sp.]